MDVVHWILVAVVIVAAIAVLFAVHYRTWKSRTAEATADGERRFLALQFRRRIQTTGVMAILAVMLFVGQVYRIPGWAGVLYWSFAFLLTIWLIFMAFGDVTATRMQVARSQQALLMERAKLQREINEAREREESDS